MKRPRPRRSEAGDTKRSDVAVPIKKQLRQEGKLTHGTRGKTTRGPRGNKKY